MLSLDNMVWILRREAEAVRRDLAGRTAYTDHARRHQERLVRLLENAIGNLEAYIRESRRPYVPVWDVAGAEPGHPEAGARPVTPPNAPEGALL